ncbi:MAG TPA: hypothetical protein VGP76_25125 [Planctomycetaceae bacterium]|jgi:hypothetical protein|nr:hypothetical protein [Planctomycetaceae bacterium]
MERRYVFFPYLKSSGALRYREVDFGSTADVSRLSSDAADHVSTLSSMFFLRDDLRIKDMSFAVLEAPEGEKIAALLEAVIEFQTFLTYLYSSPDPTTGNPFLRAEHASLFIFREERLFESLLRPDNHVETVGNGPPYEPADHRSQVAGYAGRLDQRSPLWVAKGSRIYPPTPHLSLNISQDLHVDLGLRLQDSLQYALLAFLAGPRRNSHLLARVLTSLRWYNRSVAIDVSEDVALVSLAIAFEALLGLPSGKEVTSRFKEAVALLVGPVPRLDSFLGQFYDARSQIAHEGESEDLMFRATDSLEKKHQRSAARYRSLASYARHIYRVCLLTIVHGGQMSAWMNLGRMMVTNQQRFEQICCDLSTTVPVAGQRLAALGNLIRDAATYRFVPEEGLKEETILAACRLASSELLAANPQLPAQTMKALTEFVAVTDDPDHFKTLSRLSPLIDALKASPRASDFEIDDPRQLVISLLETGWGYTFGLYFRLAGARERAVEPTS